MEKCFLIIRDFFDRNKWIVVFLLALPFVNDTYPSHYFIYFWIQDFFKIISTIILIFLFYKDRKKPSLLTGILFLSCMSLTLSTFLKDSPDVSYEKMFYDIISDLFVALIVDYYISDYISLISGLILNFEIALYPCYIGMLMNIPEEGYYPRGLLNTLILWILPAMFLAMLYLVLKKRYLRPAILIVVCIMMSIKVWSATIIVSLLSVFSLFVFGLILMKTFQIKMNMFVFIIIAFALNLFVLFVYSGGNFPLIDAFIQGVLKRTTSFTERDVIWKEAIRMIKQSPIIGNGSRPLIYAENSFSSVYIHSHNQFLQKLNEGGIIRFGLFLLFHAELARKMDASENSLQRLICVCFVFGVCITYIVEAYKDFYLFYFILFIAYHCSELEISNEYGF